MWKLIESVVEYWLITTIITFMGVVMLGPACNPQFISGISMLLAGIFFVTKYRKIYGIPEKIHLKEHVKWIPLSIVWGIAVSAFLNILVNMFQIGATQESFQVNQVLQYSVPFVIGIIIYGVIAPIAEEVVFRGLFYHELRNRMTKVMAIVISALVFGIYHGNVVQAIYAFILGCLLGYVVERTGSVTIAIFVHSAANLVSYSTSYLQDAKAIWNSPLNCVIFGIISIAIPIYIYFTNNSKK